ncbi:hypothetical protein BZA77DRAFT_344100 [Pyronema omphalodes]|nr:hypothetical protein BZA77DRAFT_344100 [Pyronema omphalodes]
MISVYVTHIPWYSFKCKERELVVSALMSLWFMPAIGIVRDFSGISRFLRQICRVEYIQMLLFLDAQIDYGREEFGLLGAITPVIAFFPSERAVYQDTVACLIHPSGAGQQGILHVETR